jgi:hypothetical protein
LNVEETPEPLDEEESSELSSEVASTAALVEEAAADEVVAATGVMEVEVLVVSALDSMNWAAKVADSVSEVLVGAAATLTVVGSVSPTTT